jgi:hypothetical protein
MRVTLNRSEPLLTQSARLAGVVSSRMLGWSGGKAMSKVLLAFACGVALVAAGAPPLGADARVGALKAVTGSVSIDAFGKGAFVSAVVGDDLYSSSVVKTDPGSSATIDLQGKTVTVAAATTVKVADLASAAGRKSGLRWFDTVARLVKSLSDSSRSADNELVLGSRGAQTDDSGGMDWDTGDSGAAARIADARKSIAGGGYAEALDTLGGAKGSGDPGSAWQISFWKGYCYYELDDYANAITHLTAARTPPLDAAGDPNDRGNLLFMLGSSLYLVGREREAVPVLDAFLKGYQADRYAPYAAVLLARSLAASGDAVRSRAVAAEAAARYRGSDVDAELTALSR